MKCSARTSSTATARRSRQTARLHFFVGDLDTAMARIESAIPVAERTKDMALLVTTLNTKAMVYSTDRPHEAYALVQAALRIALDHDLVYEALRSYNNTLVQPSSWIGAKKCFRC